MTAVLIAAIISGVSVPIPLGPGRAGGFGCVVRGPELVSSGLVLLRFAARSW